MILKLQQLECACNIQKMCQNTTKSHKTVNQITKEDKKLSYCWDISRYDKISDGVNLM